jgi:hypothetical protein
VYLIVGPFVNIAVLLYALYFMDNFGWGKTRQVISEDTTINLTSVVVGDEEPVRPALPSHPEEATVAIIGCNKYASQLAKAFRSKHKVILYDPSDRLLSSIVRELGGPDSENLIVTTQRNQLGKAGIYLITVSDRVGSDSEASDPGDAVDFTLTSAVGLVAQYVRPGQIVVIETTASVGTTRSLLKDLHGQGVICGYSPSPPNNSHSSSISLETKRVAAINDQALRILENLYRPIFKQLVLDNNLEAAELYNLYDKAHRYSQVMLHEKAQPSFTSPPPEIDFQETVAKWKNFIVDMETAMDYSTPVKPQAGSALLGLADPPFLMA